MTTTAKIKPTPLQERVLAYRGHCGIIDCGGRGSGKSFGLLLDIIDHCRDPEARVLLLRESWGGLQELADEVYKLGVAAFGPRTSRNKQSGEVRMATGAVVSLSNVGDESSYAKLQGRSFTMLAADEAGNYPPTGFAFMLRALSNLRAGPGRETRIHMTANPAGRSHARILRQFIRGHVPWVPWEDDAGNRWVVTTSTLRDNPHVDGDDYHRRLLASCGGDSALVDAWVDGRWDSVGGALLAPPWDERVHLLPEDRVPPIVPGRYRFLVGGDWGTASPCAALLVGKLAVPVGHFREGDFIVLDEVDTAIDPHDLSTGSGASVPAWAEMVKAMLKRNELTWARVVQDDARGLAGDSVCTEMRRCGVMAQRPYAKDRTGGWALIRSLLQSAVESDSRPGLWVSERCPHLAETLPEMPRSPLRPEDADPKSIDHWADALRYAIAEMHGRPDGTIRVVHASSGLPFGR